MVNANTSQQHLLAEVQRLQAQVDALIAERDALQQSNQPLMGGVACSPYPCFQNEMLETAAIWINILDRQGNVTFWNHAAERISGYSKQMVLGHNQIWQWLYPDAGYRTEVLEQVMSIIDQGQRVENFETVICCRDGSLRTISWHSNRFQQSSGRIVGSIALGADITKRKQAEQALKEANQRKDEFLALLSHELRNPLSPMLYALQIMKRAKGNSDALEQAQNIIETQLWQMVRLIDDLLDIARITRGKITLQPVNVDLAMVVNSVVDSMRPYLEANQRQLTVSLPPQPLMVQANLARLSQVLANLLTNANKFTKPRGQIRIMAQQQDDLAVIRVQDNGIGIPQCQLKNIFEIFTQIDSSLKLSQGGLGIGLALTKELVQMHGGTVHACSAGVDLGSEFVVRLPLATAVATDSETAEVAPHPTGPHAKLRVLVVDDNQDTAKTVGLLIKIIGYQTCICHDGPAALQAAHDFRPDVALLDIGMPGMNGYELAQLLRQQHAERKLLLVAMTGFGSDDDRVRCFKAGFDLHLTKPAAFDAIVNILRQYCP